MTNKYTNIYHLAKQKRLKYLKTKKYDYGKIMTIQKIIRIPRDYFDQLHANKFDNCIIGNDNMKEIENI